MLQRKDYTFDKILEGDEPGRDLFAIAKQTKAPDPVQPSLLDNAEKEKPNEEGVFLKQYISHYRRVQENG
jgi:hypothetical protein